MTFAFPYEFSRGWCPVQLAASAVTRPHAIPALLIALWKRRHTPHIKYPCTVCRLQGVEHRAVALWQQRFERNA